MVDRSRLWVGGARAATGLVIAAVCAGAVVLLGQTELPTIEREPISVTVDTSQNTDRSIVCAGSFAELGADDSRPSVAVPTGTPSVTVAGEPSDASELKLSVRGGTRPQVFTAPVGDPLAVAQQQTVSTETLNGSAASACAEPLNEQWLLGGATSLGVSTTLSLGNPGKVPATVYLSVFDENGPVESVQTAGVLVAPGRMQTVSLNGYAPERERIAVHVTTTGAPVTATLGVGQTSGISPFAVSSVTRQPEPVKSAVIPGVANVSDHSHGPSDSGDGDDFPVVVRALAPEGDGVATVRAVDEHGKSTSLGEIELVGGAIGELSVKHWPHAANAVIVEADVPVLASALGSATEQRGHDYEWFVPAPATTPDLAAGASIVKGGELVLVNPGDREAVVRLADIGGKAKASEVTLPSGAAQVVEAPNHAVLTSNVPVHAGVRVVGEGRIAGYPVLVPDPRDGVLTVYPR